MNCKHVLLPLGALAACGIALTLQADAPERDTNPSGKGIGTLQHPPTPDQSNASPGGNAGKKPGGGNGISYHNGPVMTDPINIYYIWYGNWSGNTATSILGDLAINISNSPYYRINTTYHNASGAAVSPIATLVGTTMVTNYPYGTALSDTQIRAVVQDSINAGALPFDSKGVYFVLTSQDVTASSGFCTSYCGWHTYSTMSFNSTSQVIKYSFVGNPARCPSSCAAQTTNSPNSNVGADGMASIIMHELEEAATDPQLNAWYDTRGYENADKCAWTFGTTYTTANGSLANMKLGVRDFLIQRNWVNANGGSCALVWP